MLDKDLNSIDWILIEVTLDGIINDLEVEDTFDWFNNFSDEVTNGVYEDLVESFNTVLLIYRTTLFCAILEERYEIAEKINIAISIEEDKVKKEICELYKDDSLDKAEYLAEVEIIKTIHNECVDIFLNKKK